ncbi:cytochrome P450 [Hydrogenophaga luteola]|uniref:Cytochrome P450 n=1 Tax=Hydrogenophaga luteola TaxID=1591122 RepID=A0ABV7W587_9BURK
MNPPTTDTTLPATRGCPMHRAARPKETTAVPARAWHDLPQPPGWPVLGQLPGFDVTRTHLTLERWARELGTPYRFSMGPGYRAMVIDDPEVVQQISRQRPETFGRGGRMQPVMSEMGFNGVFSAEGDAWRTQRKLVMGSLNATHLKGWLPALCRITERLAQRWDRAAADGRALEMTDELKRYTVDVTSLLAFGQDPRTLDHGGTGTGNAIQQHLELIFPAIMRRVMTPFSYWKWVRLPADRRLDRAIAAVQQHARQCIDEARRRLPGADPTAPRHALESMLLHQAGLGLSDADLVANVVTLLLAGEDTTAHGLCWTLFYLAAEPALQDTMNLQAQAVLGARNVPADTAQLAALEPFEHLALEAIRLRPVVPFNGFESPHETLVAGIAVPARTKIFSLARPPMLDPSRFPEPLRYRPERWATGEVDGRAYQPFGAGARVCPGRSLATAEMRLVLAMLLRRFRVELACRPEDIGEICALTMLPSRMPVRLAPR